MSGNTTFLKRKKGAKRFYKYESGHEYIYSHYLVNFSAGGTPKSYFGSNDACFAPLFRLPRLNNLQPWEVKIENFYIYIPTYKDVKGFLKKKKEALHFIINEGYYSDVFLTKDVEEGLTLGFEVDVSKPSNHILGGSIHLRGVCENTHYVENFHTLLKYTDKVQADFIASLSMEPVFNICDPININPSKHSSPYHIDMPLDDIREKKKCIELPPLNESVFSFYSTTGSMEIFEGITLKEYLTEKYGDKVSQITFVYFQYKGISIMPFDHVIKKIIVNKEGDFTFV